MPLLNYTTKVDSQRTASEIMAILAKHQAKQILTEYGPNGGVTGLAFMVEKGDRDLAFRLPVRTEACLEAMRRDRKIPRHFVNADQAERVAWRIMKDWVEAQLALIDTGMVDIAEVFLPYMLTPSGQTAYEMIAGRGFLQLKEGG